MAKAKNSKRLNKALRKAAKQGHSFRIDRNGHYEVKHRNGTLIFRGGLHTGNEEGELKRLARFLIKEGR